MVRRLHPEQINPDPHADPSLGAQDRSNDRWPSACSVLRQTVILREHRSPGVVPSSISTGRRPPPDSPDHSVEKPTVSRAELPASTFASLVPPAAFLSPPCLDPCLFINEWHWNGHNPYMDANAYLHARFGRTHPPANPIAAAKGFTSLFQVAQWGL